MKIILIIDDEKPFRTTIATALRRSGYDVQEAEDGPAGLAAAFARRPDLILSDVNMAGMDGWELLDKLRVRPEASAVPVILMTGQAQAAGARTSMNLGADDFLLKPFTMEQLLPPCRRGCGGRRISSWRRKRASKRSAPRRWTN